MPSLAAEVRCEAPPRCLACGSSGILPWLRKNGFGILRCGTCGLGFVWPVPGEEDLAPVYGESYLHPGGDFGYGGAEHRLRKQKRVQARRRRALLGKLGYQGRQALDYGCGDGWWMRELEKDHRLVRGIEPARAIRQEGEARLGPGRILPSLDDLPPGESYDLISLFDALEHLPDPGGTLDRLQERLGPGGWLLLVLPIADHWTARLCPGAWDQIKPPEHLWWFTRDSLGRFLESHGLVMIHTESAWNRWPRPLPFLPGWLQYPLRLPMKLLARWVRIIELGIADSVLVAARKPGTRK